MTASAPIDSLRTALAGRYDLERELGAGGMATVYLAHDLRHDRRVAIKVLRPELAAVIGAERFLREIKTIANLQHPHILGLIDSGEVNGTAYFVMPFVDGESLRDRLHREQQLPIADAVRIATEIAGALDYAHRHGIIHRDIKPENVLLHDGRAMVADFGIALAASKVGGARMTETGMSLGTPTYMSPEQAMGEREITARSDVYALGCVTYEMLVGEPPFTGPTAQAIVAKVMTAEPAGLTAQRRSVPDAVDDAVLTALSKLPADRFATAAEFAAALVAPTSTTGRTTAIGTRRPARAKFGWLPTAMAGAVAFGIGVLAAGLIWRRPASQFPPVVLKYSMTLPDSAALADPNGSGLAYAPDGSVFAYTSRVGLMLRAADRLDAVPVAGGRRGVGPFFSPDGRWLGYMDGSRVMKVPLGGGAPVTICDSCIGYSHSWGSDDTVRYHTAPPSEPNSRVLMAVSSRGGTPYEIARPENSSIEAFRGPLLVPGTRTVLFSAFTGSSSRLAVLDLGSGAITRLDQPGFSPQWVAAGFVTLGSSDGSLIALPFDAKRGRPSGPPITIARDVAQPEGFVSRAAVSASGAVVYPLAGGNAPRNLVLVGRRGTATPIPGQGRLFASPRFSPDGRRLALGISDPSGAKDIWVLDIAQRTWSRLTTSGINNRPIWTADGHRLVYSSNDDLWWTVADGSGRPESLLVANGNRFAGTVTPDGRAVVFQESSSDRAGIRSMTFDSAPASRLLVPGTFGESAPALSLDGKWLAYQSEETGQMEVYVRPYPGSGARVPVSLHGGTEPVWAHSGRELFFRSGDSLMAAAVSSRPTFTVTGRRLLFTGSFASGDAYREYDVAPDDRQFVMLSGGSARSILIGLQHAFDRLAPTR
jgi:eukaryotic-like serine/threonine-protein kinase